VSETNGGAKDLPIRVVVADDTRELQDIVRLWFMSDARLELVGQAWNGQEAVEVVSEKKPDVVVLDLMMPVMDGYTAIPLIKAAAPETKILVYSAIHERQGKPRAMEAGADAYLEKGPIDRLVWSLLTVVGRPKGTGSQGA
jgi:CheY-like chemotaxis protein